MAIKETFGEFPLELAVASPELLNPNLDHSALGWIRALQHNLVNTAPQGDSAYGSGSWGFTILRTVYTEESDLLFPVAIETLTKWNTEYYVHASRFPGWGPHGEKIRSNDGSANEEIARRFRIEVLEDKDKLNFPHLAGAPIATMKSLVGFFNQWVISVGGNPSREYPVNTRLAGCLAVDLESLYSLIELSKNEIPPLRAAISREEKQAWQKQAFLAYVWVLDARAIRQYVEGESNVLERGWAQIGVENIQDAWFYQADHWNQEYSWVILDESARVDGEYQFIL